MKLKRTLSAILCAAVALTACVNFTGCSSKEEKQVIIYSNADDEAVESMKKTLDANGYEGKYVFQSFGTSELGGKMLAEGKDIEADVITMSSYYIESAQAEYKMFETLDFAVNTTDSYPEYYAPFLANQGAILVNTDVLAENNLAAPTSVKDLANSEYAGYISVIDIQGSSTAWLMIQSFISEYGEDVTKEILTDISIGIIEGSSVMGYTEAEYETFSPERKELECQRVRQVYEACGADYVISNMSELVSLIDEIES